MATENGEAKDVAPISPEKEFDSLPGVPWSIDLNMSMTHFVKWNGDGVCMALTPAAPQQQGGYGIMPPQIRVYFNREQFERFQRLVANGGNESNIARPMPGIAIPKGFGPKL